VWRKKDEEWGEGGVEVPIQRKSSTGGCGQRRIALDVRLAASTRGKPQRLNTTDHRERGKGGERRQQPRPHEKMGVFFGPNLVLRNRWGGMVPI